MILIFLKLTRIHINIPRVFYEIPSLSLKILKLFLTVLKLQPVFTKGFYCKTNGGSGAFSQFVDFPASPSAGFRGVPAGARPLPCPPPPGTDCRFSRGSPSSPGPTRRSRRGSLGGQGEPTDVSQQPRSRPPLPRWARPVGRPSRRRGRFAQDDRPWGQFAACGSVSRGGCSPAPRLWGRAWHPEPGP